MPNRAAFLTVRTKHAGRFEARPNVGFGSFADMPNPRRHVRFTPCRLKRSAARDVGVMLGSGVEVVRPCEATRYGERAASPRCSLLYCKGGATRRDGCSPALDELLERERLVPPPPGSAAVAVIGLKVNAWVATPSPRPRPRPQGKARLSTGVNQPIG